MFLLQVSVERAEREADQPRAEGGLPGGQGRQGRRVSQLDPPPPCHVIQNI